MKRVLSSVCLFVFVGILLLFFSGYLKTDRDSGPGNPMDMSGAGKLGAGGAAQPKEQETPAGGTSQKWQKMLATDMATLETADTSKGASTVYVVSFHPQGQTRSIDEVDEINITFSEPVAPLKKAEKGEPSLIDIKPAIKGEGYWKGSTTYCFRLDEKLRLSTDYNVRFKGYTAFSGKKLEEKTWTFNTPTITIVRTVPYHNNKWQTLDQKVLAHFSQQVDIERIKNYIIITSDKGEHKFKLRYGTDPERELLYDWQKKKEDQKFYVAIEPKDRFPMASNIKVQFLKGLLPAAGNLGLQEPRELQFRTFEVFDITSVTDEFSPDEGIEVVCSNPVPVGKFLQKVSFEPAVEFNQFGEWNSHLFSINGKFRPGTTYTMKVAADAEDQFGNRLGQEKTFTVKTRDYTPVLNPPYSTHFVLESFLEKTIPIEARNVFDCEVYYKKLSPVELKTLSKDGYMQPNQINLDTCKVYRWELPVKKNMGYVLGFDLKKINLTEPGFYYINFGGCTRDYYYGHVMQLTDMAVVAKYSPSQVFLMPFNLQSGGVVPGQQFQVIGLLAPPIKGNTDGIAIFEPARSLLGKINLFDTALVSLPKPAFIWGRKSEMLDMWSFSYDDAFNYNYNPSYFYNHLLTFTDKYLYKAGQTVKYKGILRQILAGNMEIPAVKSIKGEVFNSRNQSIRKLDIPAANFTRFGTFAGEIELPKDAPTGFYRLDFKITLDNMSFTDTLAFSVEEYKPAKFEVKVNFDQKKLVAGQDFSGLVNARYLFGTPMADAEGNCVWTIQNTYFTPQGYDGFTFGTSESQTRSTIFSKDFKLDNDGNFKFGQKAFTFDTLNSVRLTVHGEVKDKDNNRIAGSQSMTVHRGEYYIGLKTGSYFFQEKKPGKIFLATVSPEGEVWKGTGLDIQIIREEWKSFQVKDASGALRWDWKKLTEDVVKEKLNLPNGKLEKDYTFQKAGFYLVNLTGKDKYRNTITTTGYFYVTGSGYVCWGVNEGRVIDLVTDKKEYKVGNQIELLVKSPFETSTALVTVEREKVIWSKVVKLNGNANTVKIPVIRSFMPNAFINVIILKERTGLKWDEDGNDIGKPEFYAGYKEVKIDAGENHLKIAVKADRKSYEPGDTVNLDILVTDPAGKPVESEVCLSVVDKGVLNLVGYELPDPFDFFWRNRPLDVKTVSTLEDVLERKQFKEKGEDPGGSTGASPFGSVVVRKNFKESAYYSAFVTTDKSGKAKITFKLPDNLTTFKAMAVAGTVGNQFGRNSADLLVKKNIILSPALPDFVRLEDRFMGGVTVTNNSEETLQVKVQAQSENVQRDINEPKEKSVSLKPRETQPVWFKFIVKTTKNPRLTFKAIAGAYQDGLFQEIPIRMPKFLEAAASYGRVEQKAVKEQVEVPTGTFRSLDRLEITLAPSAMVGVKRNFDILQEFPYDCLEQRISKEYPLVGAGDFLITYGLIEMKPERIKERVNALLKLMPNYQHASGGFKYYPDCIWPSEYLTCYAVEFLMESKKRGYAIDNSMLSSAQEFLKKVANWQIESTYPYSKNICYLLQAYAVYVLSLDNILVNDAVNNLFEVRDRIPFSGLAYLVKALEVKNSLPGYMQTVLTKTMLNKMKDEPTMTHFENNEAEPWWWVHETNVKTTSIVLETLLKVYQKFPYAEKIARWLAQTTRQKRFQSTQEHIRLFLAFTAYYEVFEKETPNFVAKVLFNDELKITESFAGKRLQSKKTSQMLTNYQPGQKIDVSFSKEGAGILYYLLRLKYYPVGRVESIDRGFAVNKTYKTLKGVEIKDNKFLPGEKYIAEITVTTNQERSFVVLDDPVPAGLKVLNPRFQTQQQLDMEKASSDDDWRGYWGQFYRSEYYFDRVEVFADYLVRGSHTWRYLVIATNGGLYGVPNTTVMEMYNPEVFGRNDNRQVQVK